ncbi:hypothetical protein BC827DRAFT_1157618 [Russula dissimulans]|nr:hypothetical protein BC827DRAFT_1157618 [Russula dissimulans]
MREFRGWTRNERKGGILRDTSSIQGRLFHLHIRHHGQEVSTGGAGCAVIVDDLCGSVCRRGCAARSLLVARDVERLVHSTVGLKRLRWKKKKGVYERSNYKMRRKGWSINRNVARVKLGRVTLASAERGVQWGFGRAMDGNQVKNSPSDVDAEEDWFDDAQLEEAVKRDPSKVKSLEALSLEYIYRDYHGSNLNILMELSQRVTVAVHQVLPPDLTYPTLHGQPVWRSGYQAFISGLCDEDYVDKLICLHARIPIWHCPACTHASLPAFPHAHLARPPYYPRLPSSILLTPSPLGRQVCCLARMNPRPPIDIPTRTPVHAHTHMCSPAPAHNPPPSPLTRVTLQMPSSAVARQVMVQDVNTCVACRRKGHSASDDNDKLLLASVNYRSLALASAGGCP